MRQLPSLLTALLAAGGLTAAGPLVASEVSSDQTTINIKKGEDPDYQILDSSDEVSGDPFLADAQARDAWKKACSDWKARCARQNKGSQIIALNCGTPKAAAGENAATYYTSTATYKIRVRIRRDAGKAK